MIAGRGYAALVHVLIWNNKPMGWDYQLRNEPIFNFVYEHRRQCRLFQGDSGFGADVIPVAGAMLGNVLIQAQANAQFRVGYHVPDDFGAILLRGFGNLPLPRDPASAAKTPKLGDSLFARAAGTAGARNLTLDGITFHAAPM